MNAICPRRARGILFGVGFGLASLLWAVPQASAQNELLIPPGAVWKYLDNGSDQGTSWRQTAFDDTSWPSAPCLCGYGNRADFQTIVGYGPNPNTKYITTYFRRAFNVSNTAIYTGLTLQVRRYPGVVVYLNGTEVWREGMSPGDITYTTHAPGSPVDFGGSWIPLSIPPSLLVDGTNVIASEVHLTFQTQSTMAFDFQMSASTNDLPTTGGLVTFIPSTDGWRYLDNGSNQGAAWRETAFDDSGWQADLAPLGYGANHAVQTEVSYGPDPAHKYITTYFRRAFSVDDAARYQSLVLNLRRYSGAVVYLNGLEVWRDSMPDGAINYLTHASTSPEDFGNGFLRKVISPSALVNGTNVLAVEVHLTTQGQNLTIFDFQLSGSDPTLPASVTRGPYLQLGTPTSMVVRWRTDNPTESYVRYGTDPANLDMIAGDATPTTEHAVQLSGLSPQTRYFYAVGTAVATLAGNDPESFFDTAPATGTSLPIRIWALGNSCCGSAALGAGDGPRSVKYAYRRFLGSGTTNLWLTLGNTSFQGGDDTAFQNGVFDMYPRVLKKSVLWPAFGLVDAQYTYAYPTTPPVDLPYFRNFTLPTNGEAGGVPSGTPLYYAFDYANVHFISLDSTASDRSAGGAMLSWLVSDLASTTQPWVIAYWNDPSYSKGDSDSDVGSASVEMRQNAVQILEQYGVDLVLNARSHSYERTFMLDGHYGLSTTFDESMKKDPGDGRADGNGVYKKGTPGRGSHDGTVYVVAGLSSYTSTELGDHPAVVAKGLQLGSLVLDIDGLRLDARYLDAAQYQDADGLIGDHFTILKGVRPETPTGLTATATASDQIMLTWSDNGRLEDGFSIEQSLDGVTFGVIATVGANTTSRAVAGLAPLTTYYFRVCAYNAGGNSEYSNTSSATTSTGPTAAPSNLTATPSSNSAITLAWSDNADNETGFVIEQSLDGISFAPIANLGSNVTTYLSTGLNDGTKYYYLVFASGSGGDSADSNIANATTLPNPPSAPAGLTATANSQTQITVSWSDTANNETGLKIERSTNGTSFAQIATAAANQTSYVNTGLSAATTYYYRVRATNTGGDSAYSNVANATTFSNPPTAPNKATVSVNSQAQLTLTWNDRSTNETGFQVERSINGVTFAQVGTVAANVTSFVNTALTPATTYYYRVRATNTGGGSAYSNIASGTTLSGPPAAPNSLTATATSGSQISLTWVDSSNSETGFKIERSLDGTTFTQIALTGVNVTSYANSGLSETITYYYRVRATNTAGDSAYTVPANATTQLSTPTGLAGTSISNSVTLTWTNASTKADGVTVERSTNGTNFTQIASLGKVTTYTDGGRTKSTTYYYRVRAYAVAGTVSTYSAVVSLKTKSR